MKRLLLFSLFTLMGTSLWSCNASNGNEDTSGGNSGDDCLPIDAAATKEIRALFANLKKIADSGRFLFGQQDATSSGYGWCDDSGRSDIREVTGKYPAFYSWDFMDFTRPDADNSYAEEKIRRLTKRAYDAGAVNSYCWHFWNPVTDGSFYDTTEVVVSRLLPEGSHHERYKRELERIARYSATLVGSDGRLIPIIFRPFHEFDGNWFWWGASHCTADEYKALYRFTVHYLRDTLGVHNFLYAFSPDCGFETEAGYLERYPGDEYVDIVAMDNYWNYREERNELDLAHRKLKVLSDYAAAHGKIAALSETGQAGVTDPDWYTTCLMKTIRGYADRVSLGYVAIWRNSVQGYFSPYKGHPAEADFIRFCNDSDVIMGDSPALKGIYGF